MKTQIVYLEPHDDYNSVRDKLNWTQAPRVIIVWPGRGRVLSRRFDLVMLQRYARKKGTRIGLVTLDPDVLHHAESLQIPTFDSLEYQPEKAWRVRGSRKISKPTSSGKFPSLQSAQNRTGKKYSQMNLAARIATFSVGFLAFLSLVILLVPQAVITVKPETLNIVKTYSIGLELDQAGVISNYSHLPARQIQSTVEGRLRFPTTGIVSRPDQSARGEVTFINRTDQSLIIPTGTTVRTLVPSTPHFITQSPVNLDPEEGAIVTVEVVASSPGPEGNVKAEAIQAIDGHLGLSATVINFGPITGGSLKFRSAVSSIDLRRVRRELENDLLDKAHQALLGLAQEGEDLIPGSIHLLKTVEEHFSIEIGEAADSLELSLIVIFEGWVYSPNGLHSALYQILINDLSKGENIQPDTLRILEIADIAYGDEDEGPSIDVTISAQTFFGADSSVIRDIVKGKIADEALEDLKKIISLVEIINVDFSPAWLNRFPILDLQIRVRYPWEANS